MKSATGLTLVAIGAILAFAVNAHPRVLNIQVAGWVIMATGVAGLFIPRRGYGWLRRRMVLRRGPRGKLIEDVDETRFPPYIMLNPAASAAADDKAADDSAAKDGTPEGEEKGVAQRVPPGDSRRADAEIVEEYREE